MAITIVIADDHPLVVEALVALFEPEKEFEIVGLCADGEETLAALKKYDPDILLLDLHMPRMDGIAVLLEMKKENLSTRVVMLCAELSQGEFTEAVRLGARGLILKELPSKLILQCVRDVHAGKLWLEKRSVSSAFDNLLQREAGRSQAALLLTPREIQVVKCVTAGFRNAEIGKLLHISEGTVKMHLHNIYRKLKIDGGRLNLSRWAHEKGLAADHHGRRAKRA